MEPLNQADKPDRARWRFGPITLCVVIGLFAFVLAPVAWVVAYRIAPVPGTMLMVDRAFEGQDARAQWVSLDAISPHLARAAIGAEDSRFCQHGGFDLEAIENALKANARASNHKRGKMRGGSTISQQTAKNVFAWADRAWARKGIETVYTVLIEALWPKRRIMEAYLNVAEWGDGRFGAEVAARSLFETSARGLNERDAAALAAILPSPNRWSADNPGRYVRSRIGAIVSRARVVRSDGLSACVYAPGAGGAPAAAKPKSRPATPQKLPPLPPPPQSEAAAIEDGAPIEQGIEDGINEALVPEAPAEPVTEAPVLLEPPARTEAASPDPAEAPLP